MVVFVEVSRCGGVCGGESFTLKARGTECKLCQKVENSTVLEQSKRRSVSQRF